MILINIHTEIKPIGLISVWILINIIIFVSKKKITLFLILIAAFLFLCNGDLHDFD